MSEQPEATTNPEGSADLVGGSEPTTAPQQAETATPPPASDTLIQPDPTPEPAEPAQPSAPERYEFRSPDGVPEGHELDASFVESFSTVARELDLSQDNAQKVIDTVVPKLFERAGEQQRAQIQEWRTQAQQLPELQEGRGLDANLKIASEAGAKFGGDGFSDMLQQFPGLGNHPAFVSMLFRIGRAIQPDGFVTSGQQAPTNFPAPGDFEANAALLYGGGS